MGEKIARYYVADKNPDGGFFPGVPLRDLTEDEYDALPDWVQRSVDAHDMYRKTPVRDDKPAANNEDKPTTTTEKDGGN